MNPAGPQLAYQRSDQDDGRRPSDEGDDSDDSAGHPGVGARPGGIDLDEATAHPWILRTLRSDEVEGGTAED